MIIIISLLRSNPNPAHQFPETHWKHIVIDHVFHVQPLLMVCFPFRLISLLPLLYMGRKRRVPASFDWTPVLDVGDTLELPDIHVRHSHVHLDPLGPSSSRTTFISAPASPSKSDGPSDYYDDNDYNWNNEPAPPEINTNDFPFLDPAYTHFLDLNEPGPPRRPRTIEVRAQVDSI